jgi:hypothetical protein
MFSFTPQPLRPNTRAGPLSSKPGSAPHVLKDRSGTSLHRKDHMRRVRLSGCKIAATFGEQAQGVSTHDIIDLMLRDAPGWQIQSIDLMSLQYQGAFSR